MKQPEPIEFTTENRDALITRIRNSDLADDDKNLIIGILDFNLWLQMSISEKTITINKLRRAFTPQSERRKTRNKPHNHSNKNTPDSQATSENSNPVAERENTTSDDNNSERIASPAEIVIGINTRKRSSNKGKMGHDAYINAEIIIHKAPYKAGDPCPEENCDGKLKSVSPGTILKIVGQSFAKANKHILEKYRCNLCEKYFGAKLTEHVCTEKYDPTFKALLCVHKHFLGIPSYRLQSYQSLVGVPLPDSTQFDKIEDVANNALPIFRQMEQFAANGHLAHADDTTVKIQTLIKENKRLGLNEGTGMFTTGIVSFYKDHQIHLFYSGRKHCGENMLELLEKVIHYCH